MKLFKISTIALAMALSGWIACSSDNNGGKSDAPVISGNGGTMAPDGPMGTGGSGGSLDAAVLDSAVADAPIQSDINNLDSGPVIDAPPPFDGGTNPCTSLTADQCHLAIINPATNNPSVSALDPGPNPTVPYPNCAAQ